jgi:hypothetical protein
MAAVVGHEEADAASVDGIIGVWVQSIGGWVIESVKRCNRKGLSGVCIEQWV